MLSGDHAVIFDFPEMERLRIKGTLLSKFCTLLKFVNHTQEMSEFLFSLIGF